MVFLLLLAEAHAVGALIHCGIALVGANQNGIQRAVVLGPAVVGALIYGTLDALVGMTVHKRSSSAFLCERSCVRGYFDPKRR